MSNKPSLPGAGTAGAQPGMEDPPPDPGARSGILAGVSFIAGVVTAVALSDAPYPRPGSEPADVRRYFQGNPEPARASAWPGS